MNTVENGARLTHAGFAPDGIDRSYERRDHAFQEEQRQYDKRDDDCVFYDSPRKRKIASITRKQEAKHADADRNHGQDADDAK